MKKRQILSAVMGGVFMLSGISGILPLCTCSDAASSADMDIQDFPLSDVAMLDSYSTNAFSKELEYLLSFDTNRLLAGFRENAGMNTFGAKRYGGWENTNIAGHTVGHYLSAVAQAYQNPSITEKQRSELYGKITAIIDGMRECQKNSKGKTGFVWAAAHPNGTGVEVQFDNVEAGKSNIISEGRRFVQLSHGCR